MNLGIMPVTGIPLPFVSYGGSSTITAFVVHGSGAQRPHAPVQLDASPIPDVGGSLRRVSTGRLAAHDHPSGLSSNRCWPRSASQLVTSGARTGRIRPDHSPDTVSWLLIYPDTYEIGLPEPGPADPLRDPQRTARRRGRARPTRPGSTSRPSCGPPGCRCSASTPTGRRRCSTCWRSTCRPS